MFVNLEVLGLAGRGAGEQLTELFTLTRYGWFKMVFIIQKNKLSSLV